MTEFAKGQYVELYPTIPSSFGDSVAAGTRGIIQAVDPTRPDDDIYLVEFLASERLTGEQAWLRAIDLFGWRGERHRGGYGTEGPEHATLALGLVLGPWRPEPGKPRIEIYVGRHHVIGLDAPHTRLILWNQLRRPLGTPPANSCVRRDVRAGERRGRHRRRTSRIHHSRA